jgi:hypothetical protein
VHAVEHGIGPAIFALVFVEEALRRETARDVAQLVGAIEQIKAHRHAADHGIGVTEQRVAQRRQRAAIGNAKGGLANGVGRNFAAIRASHDATHCHAHVEVMRGKRLLGVAARFKSKMKSDGVKCPNFALA